MTSAFCAARVTVVAQASGDFAGSHPYARIKRAGPRRNSATVSGPARVLHREASGRSHACSSSSSEKSLRSEQSQSVFTSANGAACLEFTAGHDGGK